MSEKQTSMPQETLEQHVLVLDADMVPALTIARSLGKKGIAVTVASSTAKPIAGFSRYASARLRYPDPLTEESAFLHWLTDQIDHTKFDLVIPVTERTVVPILSIADSPQYSRIAMPPKEALALALDKDQTMRLAQELDIATPRSILLTAPADLQSQEAQTLSMPVVVKPARSIGKDKDQRKQLSVDYANDALELSRKAEHYLRYGPVLLQEYKKGLGVGIELIADNGNVVYAFQHQRMHEVPLTGGGSSLRKSVPINQTLLDASQRLMKALAWHGVAMVEFKWDTIENTYSLMEINGRFWGSLPLAAAANADFPAMLFELETQGRISQRAPATTGIVCRKLSSDIHWQELVTRRIGVPRIVSFPSRASALRDWAMMFSRKHYFDVQQWRDPYPGLIDLVRIAQEYLDRLKSVVKDRLTLRKQRQAWENGTIRKRLRNANTLLFVCYGNINRSPLAEYCVKKHCTRASVVVFSAGFHNESGRPADPVMTSVAHGRGIDLSACASRILSEEDVNKADLIFVMELQHLERITREFPRAATKTFLLGMAAANSAANGEIPDPYGQTYDDYARCHGQVEESAKIVARLASE